MSIISNAAASQWWKMLKLVDERVIYEQLIIPTKAYRVAASDDSRGGYSLKMLRPLVFGASGIVNEAGFLDDLHVLGDEVAEMRPENGEVWHLGLSLSVMYSDGQSWTPRHLAAFDGETGFTGEHPAWTRLSTERGSHYYPAHRDWVFTDRWNSSWPRVNEKRETALRFKNDAVDKRWLANYLRVSNTKGPITEPTK